MNDEIPAYRKKPDRRTFLGYIGAALGGVGFLAGASALSAGGGGGGGAPIGAKYLVGAADPDLTDEIVAGTTPGGQLGNVWSSPDVRGLRETTGPTLLTLGSVVDGSFLKRSGSSVIGDTPTAALPTGTLVEKVYDGSDASISAIGDNQAGITFPADATMDQAYYEALIQVLGTANAQWDFAAAIHDPAHTALETFRARSDPTGAGDIFHQTLTPFARGAYASGSWHLNVTIKVGGNVTVVQRRGIGRKS